MFNGHTMTVVTDLNVLGPSINDIDYLTVAAITTGEYPNLPNIYNASILVPPTSILMQWADGDQMALSNLYPQYLLTREPDDMIVALIAAMTQRNIALYIPHDDFNVYGVILMNHLYYQYGITCNSMLNTTFNINTDRLPYIMAKFYMIDVMTPEEFLRSYPATALLPDFTINKLAEELHPFNYYASFQQYADYFNKVNASKGLSMTMQPMVKIVGDNKK